jgi:hypothetical protein
VESTWNKTIGGTSKNLPLMSSTFYIVSVGGSVITALFNLLALLN